MPPGDHEPEWRDIEELHKGGQQPEAGLTFVTTSGTSDIQKRGSCNQVCGADGMTSIQSELISSQFKSAKPTI
jgi:hypothetical protein